MSKGFASNLRMTLLAVGVLTCFTAVGARLVFLHVIDREELLKFVEKARRQIVVEHARRGTLTDTKGNVLATSRSYIVLGADPEMLRDEDSAKWGDLARLLGVNFLELDRTLRRTKAASQLALADQNENSKEKRIRYVKLADEIDERVYDRIMDLRIRGIYGSRGYKRVYPGGQLAAHLLGYINKENTPVTGAEKHLDLYLKGQDGWIESEKDGVRREMAQFRTREVQPIDGHDVVLTLDSVIQNILERELDAIAMKFKPKFATIIVSDPRTGAILGMANYPTYDLNNFSTAPIENQRNNAITDIIEPGSTFKIVAAGAALNDGVVNRFSTFDCDNPVVFVNGKERKLPKEDHAMGTLTVAEIVSKSSNRGAAHLAMKLGDQRYYDYVKAFGFGDSTRFQLGGEVRGLLDEPKRWDGLTITRMPMGHAIAATPLQIHMAMSAVANGGVLLRPQIIKEIRGTDGAIVRVFAPEKRAQVLRPSVAAELAQMLHGVTQEGGTGAGFDLEGFEIAAKTGTTQKIVDGKYVNNRHVASFVGFFPASRPEVVLTVIVDDAHVAGGTAYGRAVSAPAFKHVAEQLIQYLDIKPVRPSTQNLLAMSGGAR
ncbi:MAG: penicillin-binding protein 2 [Candidatus Didemnitutus sp.]|nr:penicillin-binding protein 2 [Candidatus Didemnitutus sp.]